jgi:hypothetical protein
MPGEQASLLQRVQPAMVGLVDGSLATLAPIFAVALATHKSLAWIMLAATIIIVISGALGNAAG